MKKMLLLLLLVVIATSVSAQDSLDYRSDYYFSKRNAQERVPISRHHVVMLGNSLTERGNWERYFPDCKIVNRGIGGDVIDGMIARIGPIVKGKPKAIFIMAGINDLLFSTASAEALCARYARLLDRIHAAAPHIKIYIQSLLPINEQVGGEKNESFLKGKNPRIAVFNALLRELAARRSVTYIDLWSSMMRDGAMISEYTEDGIHLTAEGYRIWTAELTPYIQ